MIFRQLFDSTSGTYTYLLASRRGGEALIIDPVLEKVDRYLQLLRELDLQTGQSRRHPSACRPHHRPRRAARPHPLHHRDGRADPGRCRLRCVWPKATASKIEGVRLDVLYTPGHTDNSYSFVLGDRVFTGDTLLIRGTGRTDFQNGDPRAQYDSIFNKLMKLPDETLVYPAHDYKGDTVSTIGEEKSFNPRLKVKSIDEYVELMNNLKLPNPKMMDVAVPANMRVGLRQEEIARSGWALSAARRSPSAAALTWRWSICARKASVTSTASSPGSLHAPYPDLQENIGAGGLLHELAAATGKRLVFYCAFGERSAMAVQAAQDAGSIRVPHRGRHRCMEEGGWTADALTHRA